MGPPSVEMWVHVGCSCHGIYRRYLRSPRSSTMKTANSKPLGRGQGLTTSSAPLTVLSVRARMMEGGLVLFVAHLYHRPRLSSLSRSRTGRGKGNHRSSQNLAYSVKWLALSLRMLSLFATLRIPFAVAPRLLRVYTAHEGTQCPLPTIWQATILQAVLSSHLHTSLASLVV
jgi:hypothetical protein